METNAVIPSSELLVEQCLVGEHAAYKQLYDRYSRSMYNTALRIVNKKAEAEDILQDAFTDAFLKLSSFENKSTFGAWLKQIVVYKSIAALKRNRFSFVDMEIAEEIPDESEYPEDAPGVYNTESIKEALASLPEGYRTVLLLYLFEGYDHEEIAEILGVAKSTVRTQYIRAKQKLAGLLKKGNVYEI